MFHSLFTHAGRCFPGRAARQSVMRAASLAAITVLMLGTLSDTAVAQATNTPLRAYFTKLVCLDETDDGTIFSNSDEPYVVILVADLRGSNDFARIFFSQTFSDVDKNETRSDFLQIWALDGTGQPIGSDNDYIILAALLEEDDWGNRLDIDKRLTRSVIPKLVSYKASGMSRPAIASALREDMNLAIEMGRVRFPLEDDRVGPVFEIIWGTDRLSAARSGHAMNLSALVVGSGSKYQLEFRLQ